MSSRPNPKAFMYLALGTVVVGGGLCYFQYTKLGDINSRVAKLKTEVSDPNAVKSRLEQSNIKLEGAQQSLKHLEANVSSAAYVPSLLHDLDDYGKKNGISVTGVRPAQKMPGDDKDKAAKPYDELNIQVTGSGSFDAIENFVTNLSTFPKIVAARLVSIEPIRGAGSDAKPGELNMTVQLKAYVFKPDASDAAAKTATATTPAAANGAAPTAASPAPGSTGAPTNGASPANGAAPAATAPATKNQMTTTPAVNQPAVKGKTALARTRGVRVEG